MRYSLYILKLFVNVVKMVDVSMAIIKCRRSLDTTQQRII